MQEQDNNKRNHVLDNAAAAQTINNMSNADAFGVSKDYERQLYDSQQKKNYARDQAFGDKKTIRGENGELLHKGHEATKRKYGEEKWGDHAAEADHIDPLKQVHERHKKDLFITDEDLKEIANREKNLQMISKRENTSKGGKTELQMAWDDKGSPIDKRIRRGVKGIKAQAETDILVLKRQGQHIMEEFQQGAQDALAASVIPLAIRGTQDLIKVANGELSMYEAVKDVGELGVSIVASGGSVRIATSALGQVLKNSDSDIVKNFAKANQIGNLIIVGSIVVRASGMYLSGEVDAAGFWDEISREGVGLISGTLASKAVVGILGTSGVVGTVVPVLTAMIVSSVCTEIYEQAKWLQAQKKDNREIRFISEQASQSIKEQKDEIKRLLSEDHEQWVSQMTNIFRKIATGITENDVSITKSNLQELARIYSKHIVLYETNDDMAKDLMAARRGEKTGIVWG